MGIEFTMPACKPKYMFARQTPEPKRTAHASILGVNTSLTEERGGSGTKPAEPSVGEDSGLSAIEATWLRTEG